MLFSIVTDTSANLPAELVRKHRITVVPFSYYANGVEYAGTEIGEARTKYDYEQMRSGVRYTTSQITPQRYMDYMRPLLEEGKDLLYVGMSSGVSGAYHSAELAAMILRGEFPQRQIALVDSLGASLGEGLLVLQAVQYREQGMSLSETAEQLLEWRMHISQIFIVDDLMYLRQGGRISHVKAVAGKVLNIKPLLKGDSEGHIVDFGKVRGRKHAIEALVEKYSQLVRHPKKQTIGISHADCEEDAKRLAALLRNMPEAPGEILTVLHEPATGVHIGPGSLALYFTGDSDVRQR